MGCGESASQKAWASCCNSCFIELGFIISIFNLTQKPQYRICEESYELFWGKILGKCGNCKILHRDVGSGAERTWCMGTFSDPSPPFCTLLEEGKGNLLECL